MNKAEFIESVFKMGGYETKAEAGRAYDTVVGALATRLSKGNAKERVIRLPELGTFQMKTRKARNGRNPQTGKAIKIPAKKVVAFKAGKGLSDNL
ncbi:MAG: HU family DNA-binding protein [Candidatus Omnitrophica bacterium]|nr:HU family DNA-binding protein [Candidatus Omnitrophota bacterium]MDD5488590.1 HU family DNA-binding protein [Candidatus Omnitrophota bacterium]